MNDQRSRVFYDIASHALKLEKSRGVPVAEENGGARIALRKFLQDRPNLDVSDFARFFAFYLQQSVAAGETVSVSGFCARFENGEVMDTNKCACGGRLFQVNGRRRCFDCGRFADEVKQITRSEPPKFCPHCGSPSLAVSALGVKCRNPECNKILAKYDDFKDLRPQQVEKRRKPEAKGAADVVLATGYSGRV